MDYVAIGQSGGVATLTLARGKVNALNRAVVRELTQALTSIEADGVSRAVVITGQGKFFSFGFDIPEFLSHTPQDFAQYLTEFTALCAYIFLYPKPIVAALNGHAIAGGCMLALACDLRVMVSSAARISLNEIGFGSSVFAGTGEMLRFWVGGRSATTMLYSGAMYSAEEARELGLVEMVVAESALHSAAADAAAELGAKDAAAFASIKRLLRTRLAEEAGSREAEAIREFVELWYSPSTREHLKKITIRS